MKRFSTNVAELVICCIDENLETLKAEKERGIESNSPATHRRFEETMERSIQATLSIRRQFIDELQRINAA